MMLPLAPDENVTEAPKLPASEAPRAERWGNHHPVHNQGRFHVTERREIWSM